MNKRDLNLLKSIQSYFGDVGNITNADKFGMQQFRVTSIEGLRTIINHFNKYPLKTQKQADYLLFLEALELYSNKEHLTLEGLIKIAAIKASMNLGITSTIKDSFNIIPVVRPEISNQIVPDPH